jgi:hypothetical protein
MNDALQDADGGEQDQASDPASPIPDSLRSVLAEVEAYLVKAVQSSEGLTPRDLLRSRHAI